MLFSVFPSLAATCNESFHQGVDRRHKPALTNLISPQFQVWYCYRSCLSVGLKKHCALPCSSVLCLKTNSRMIQWTWIRASPWSLEKPAMIIGARGVPLNKVHCRMTPFCPSSVTRSRASLKVSNHMKKRTSCPLKWDFSHIVESRGRRTGCLLNVQDERVPLFRRLLRWAFSISQQLDELETTELVTPGPSGSWIQGGSSLHTPQTCFKQWVIQTSKARRKCVSIIIAWLSYTLGSPNWT